MRNAGAYILVSLFAAACGVGDDGDTDKPLEQIDPNPNKVRCSAAFKTQGTFTPKAPLKPADVSGCWPVGTWTFTATIDGNAEVLDVDKDGVGDRCQGAAAPKLAASYSFVVDRTPDPLDEGWTETYTYTGDTAIHSLHVVKVSEGGGGECEGAVELVSADKKQYWVLKPSLLRGSLGGFGEYTEFIEPQPY